MPLRNPAFALSPTLPLTQITPLNYCTSAKGVFDDTTPAQMHQAIQAFASVSAQKTLALFFHGGLVSKTDGLQSAQQLLAPYAAGNDPQDNAGNAYPYFFVWESGLLETLQHNLPGIIAETIFQRVRDIVGNKAQSVLTGSAPNPSSVAQLRVPTLDVQIRNSSATPALTAADIDEVQQLVEADPLISNERQRIADAARPLADAFSSAAGGTPRLLQASAVTLLSPEIVSAIVAEQAHRAASAPAGSDLFFDPISLGSLALGAGKVLMRIIERYAAGRNHTFHNTVTEEIFRQFYLSNIGWAIWNEMKVETAEAFQGDAQHNVGTAMIGELTQLFDSLGNPGSVRITLLGHSTGAVYICNFLQAARQALQSKPYANAIQFDVIFMAPAVRVDVLANTLSTCAGLIRNFRVFEMSDPIESTEALVQMENGSPTVNAILAQIYTSSLLYFITGVLEDTDDDTPIDGMQRYFSGSGAFAPGRIASIDAVAAFYGSRPNRVIRSDTGPLVPQPPLGQRCTAHHHGGFPIDPGTLQSVCYLLKTGNYT